MRCRRCRARAIIQIARHHTAFCEPCYLRFFREQVQQAIRKWKMFTPEDRILVAVSGGKDSLALWDVLLDLGYPVTGLHIDLGIGEYSLQSREKVEAYAREKRVPLRVVDLQEAYGGGIPEMAQGRARRTCSTCGTVKRYLFNRMALEGGFTVIATGHNLDDEAARLLGNLLRWQMDYLTQQLPVLPASHPRLARKVKPLCRLTEREIAAYAVLRRIDYVIEECPMSAGAHPLVYKDLLNRLEETSPGTKQAFYGGFLREGHRAFIRAQEPVALETCARCGEVTTSEICSFCRLVERLESTAVHETSRR